MLKLRQEHLKAFDAQAVSLFSSRAMAHVKAVWPAECAELGERAVAEMVRNSIQRAAAFGLSSEHDVVRYVDLSFILAGDFDTHPLATWTKPILADRKVASGARMDRLYQRMEEEFNLIEKRRGGKP